MTHKEPEQLVRELSRLTLSDAGRARMRERLAAYADLHAVPAAERPGSVIRRAVAALRVGERRLVYGFVAVVLVIATGGTAAYAAEGTVPGDLLYPVKVSVAEPVAGALAATPVAKAQWNADVAEHRLNEAATLASRGTLDSQTRTYLEAQFAKHADAADQVATDAQSAGNVAMAAHIRSDLEARLSAHEELLALAAVHLKAEGADSAATEAGDLAQAVDLRKVAIAHARMLAEHALALAHATSSVTDINALALATDAVDRTAAEAADHGVLDGGVAARIDSARAALGTARASLAADHAGSAYLDAEQARRSAAEASILVKNRALLRSLLASTTQATTTAATSTPSAEKGEPEEHGSAPKAPDIPDLGL